MNQSNDDDLRARFRAMAREDAHAAPAFSLGRIDAVRPVVRARRLWYSASGIGAIAAAAAIAIAIWPKAPPYPIDLRTTAWAAPTDFLLDTPGSALLRTVPVINTGITTRPTDTGPTDAARDRGDTSGSIEP